MSVWYGGNNGVVPGLEVASLLAYHAARIVFGFWRERRRLRGSVCIRSGMEG